MNAKLKHTLPALALAIGCAATLPAAAQETTNATPRAEQRDDGRDFGWIGLFGLIGLAGLMGRKRDHNHYEATRGTATGAR